MCSGEWVSETSTLHLLLRSCVHVLFSWMARVHVTYVLQLFQCGGRHFSIWISLDPMSGISDAPISQMDALALLYFHPRLIFWCLPDSDTAYVSSRTNARTHAPSRISSARSIDTSAKTHQRHNDRHISDTGHTIYTLSTSTSRLMRRGGGSSWWVGRCHRLALLSLDLWTTRSRLLIHTTVYTTVLIDAHRTEKRKKGS